MLVQCFVQTKLHVSIEYVQVRARKHYSGILLDILSILTVNIALWNSNRSASLNLVAGLGNMNFDSLEGCSCIPSGHACEKLSIKMYTFGKTQRHLRNMLDCNQGKSLTHLDSIIWCT